MSIGSCLRRARRRGDTAELAKQPARREFQRHARGWDAEHRLRGSSRTSFTSPPRFPCEDDVGRSTELIQYRSSEARDGSRVSHHTEATSKQLADGTESSIAHVREQAAAALASLAPKEKLTEASSRA